MPGLDDLETDNVEDKYAGPDAGPNVDVDALSQNAGNVGQGLTTPTDIDQLPDLPTQIQQQQQTQPQVDAVSGADTASPVSAQQTPVVSPQQTQNLDALAEVPDASKAAPSISPPAPVTPPVPPKITGNVEQDSRNNIEYLRKLTDFQAQLMTQQSGKQQQANEVNSRYAEREAAAARESLKAREEINQRRQQEREVQQQAITSAISERAQAMTDLKQGFWADKSMPFKIAAILGGALGGLGAAMENMGMVQGGHAPTAQNEGLNTINKIMDQDYQHKLERVHASDTGILQAQHGFDNSEENYRAALNNVDADRAAKYTVIAKEGETELLKRGLTPDQVKANPAIIQLYQKAAESEQAILDRQAERHLQSQHYRAEEAMAGAHLDLQRAQVDATLSDKKDQRDEKRDERAFHDPDTGNLRWYAGSARQVPRLTDQVIAGRQYAQSLRDLADDIEHNGRVGSNKAIIGTEAGTQRESKFSAAVARGRKALDLGVSNANIQLEHGALGGSGAGLDTQRMADPKRLREIADEQDRITRARMRAQLKAPSDEQKARSVPAVPPEGSKKAPKAAPAGPTKNGVPQAVIDQAFKALADKKSSPADRQDAVKALVAANLL